jgi:histidine triad (HIT) family protein
MTTIFSRIILGEIPSYKIYEDAETYAFLDISPAAPGHTLVICKSEVANLYELSDTDLIATARTTQRVASVLRAVLQPDGINVVQNNGAAAGQTVFHYHVHLIPRWEDDGVFAFWKPQSLATERMQELQRKLAH